MVVDKDNPTFVAKWETVVRECEHILATAITNHFKHQLTGIMGVHQFTGILGVHQLTGIMGVHQLTTDARIVHLIQ